MKKILVVQTSYLGDVVLTMPLLSELKRRFPRAVLSVLCTPQAKDLLDGNPEIDEIITDDKKGRQKGWAGLWRKAQELRSRGFTLALSPHKSFRSALLLFLAGVPYRVGFRQSAGWFFYHARAYRDSDRHDVERNLSILQPLGIDPEDCRRVLRIDADLQSQQAVEGIFRSLGVERNGLALGINPGSVWPTKRWTADGYADLIVQLKRKYDCKILLFGGPEDSHTVSKIQELSGHVGVNLAGKLSLKELACALDWCGALITNDSGPMHLAVARGVPVVAIFCATTPSLGFYPYSSRAVVVQKGLSCRPCSSHGGRRCPLGTEDCIRLIKTNDVLRGVERLLNGGKKEGLTRTDAHLPQLITL